MAVEEDETFLVLLSSSDPAVRLDPAEAVVTIVDDLDSELLQLHQLITLCVFDNSKGHIYTICVEIFTVD